MHSQKTHDEFLRLRARGLSLGRISRQLGVSKPTLVAWNRRAQPEVPALALADHQQLQSTIVSSTSDELAQLTRRLAAVKQELFSRAIRDCPTSALEQIAGQRRQQIDSLSHPTTTPSANANFPSSS